MLIRKARGCGPKVGWEHQPDPWDATTRAKVAAFGEWLHGLPHGVKRKDLMRVMRNVQDAPHLYYRPVDDASRRRRWKRDLHAAKRKGRRSVPVRVVALRSSFDRRF